MRLAVRGVLQPVFRQTVRHVRSTPFTLFVLAAFLVVALVSGSILSGPPDSLLPVAGVTLDGLKAGEWWSIWSSLFFTTNVPAFFVSALMVLTLGATAEQKARYARLVPGFWLARAADEAPRRVKLTSVG